MKTISNRPVISAYQVALTTHDFGWRKWPNRQIIRWTFGFANPSAVAYGLRGRLCRGEEYVIVLDWSRSRRQVWMNNIQIHESSTSGDNWNFAYSFDLRTKFDNQYHIVQVVATATAPTLIRKLKQVTEEEHHQLFLDGEKFSDMTQIYQLGNPLSSSTQYALGSTLHRLTVSSTAERDMIALAKARSLKDQVPTWRVVVGKIPLPMVLFLGGLVVLKAEESGYYMMGIAPWIRFCVQCILLHWALTLWADQAR